MTDLSLSIVIPTHNRPDLVRRAVTSALRSGSDVGEVLVVDDASDPPAERALADLAATDARLRVLRNDGPRGAAGARNFGVSQARGEVILFLDDDDEMLPTYPARVLRAVAAPSGAGFGFSAVIGRSGGEDRVERRSYPSGFLPPGTPLRHRIAATSAGFWISRALFLAQGGFAPDQVVDEDTSLCCTLAAAGVPVWHDAEPGVIVYRDHSPAGSGASQLTRSTRAEIVAACYLRTWQRHDALFPTWSEARWYLATRYLRRAVKSGQRAESWAAVRAARPAGFAVGLALFRAAKVMSNALRSGSAGP
jgi:glycosyltransferase involved in cell wall biosynthesis